MKQRRPGEDATDRQQAVIFDFDGTIADSLRAVIDVFEDLTGRTERFTDAQIEAFRELSLPELVRELQVPKWKVPALLLRGRKMMHQHLHGIPVHRGMVEALERLHASDIPLFVLSSNSTENVESYLAWHKLSHLFTGVYGGASLLGKAPRLLKLIDEQRIDVTRSWYVGDETRDVSAARSVGLHSASVTWGYNTRAALERKRPDALVESANELVTKLESVWKK
jgi:phosphoglycolate phosphatase-like HAD superfamily hydrolase